MTPTVGQTPLWDMDWIYEQVAALPVEALIQLAKGPRHGWDCTVCRVIGSFPPVLQDTPAQKLSYWHSEIGVLGPAGRGGSQDPSRCGVIYGIAKAIVCADLDCDLGDLR